MIRKHVRPLLALAAIVLAALGGCGDSNSTSALTKAEFIDQGNLICQKWEQEREEEYVEVAQRYQGQKSTQQIREKAVIKILLHPYERMISKLAELTPPEGEEQKVEIIVRAMEDAASEIEADPSVPGAPFDRPNELVVDYGLTECRY